MKRHIFDFTFDKDTINSYIIAYCKENHIDWFNGSLGGIYAKIDPADRNYYKLEVEYSESKGCFEVYANMMDHTLRYKREEIA